MDYNEKYLTPRHDPVMIISISLDFWALHIVINVAFVDFHSLFWG